MSKLLKLKKEFRTFFLLHKRKDYETRFMLAFYFKFAALSTELCFSFMSCSVLITFFQSSFVLCKTLTDYNMRLFKSQENLQQSIWQDG